MSAGLETYQTAIWLRSTLAAGTALCALVGGTASPRIYPDFIPQGVEGDSVIYSVLGATDETVCPGTAAAVRTEFLVKAVVQDSSYSRCADIMAQAHPLIAAQRGTVYAGTVPQMYVLQCVREEGVQYFEVTDGKRYAHLGGRYRIWVENA